MKRIIVCGIDPGFNGGVAFLWNGKNNDIRLLRNLPMPVLKEKNKKQLDALSLLQLFKRYNPSFTMVEKVQAMPKQGIVSTGNYMYSAGVIRGILVGRELAHDFVRPQEWKKDILKGTRKEKIDAIIKVTNLFPKVNLKKTERCRKLHDGMAEAILIALYGFKCFLKN